ncbi:MAG TPA: (Fe-S)-binding protein [Candidatus Binataceae bacterium]|nr:(Fe-S)-binding protein [Candidatus Binataceae bacterium]
MNQEVTRQILWNIPTVFVVLLYGMLIPLTAAFVWVGLKWYRIVTQGTATAESRFDQPVRRLFMSFRDGVGQGFVGRETWGWMHYAFLVAFTGLFIGTSIVFVNDDMRRFLGLFGIHLYFYYGDFYLVFKAVMDTCFLLLIAGVIGASMRRAIVKPALLDHPANDKLQDNWENRVGYWLPLLLLTLVPITGLMLEGARINANPPGFVEWAYIGRAMGRIEGALGAGATFHRYLWLFHVMLVYGLLFCLPFTKLRHFLIAPLNLYFRNLGPRGRLAPIKDFENAETFGVAQVEQYSWKQLLDMASCLECGRCTINCPTVNTGKALNPKFLVIAQREHLLDKAPTLLAIAAHTAHAEHGAPGGHAGHGAESHAYDGPDMITEVATEDVIWGCTTCGWCEEGCPVGIEHIQRIVDMRRHQTLMESKFPTQATNAFKGIENQGNPWGLAQEKRAEWAAGLDIPVMAEVEKPEELDVLYWVGCAGSYDERNQKVSRSFAGLMKQAGVRFGILGTEEICTGDPARRLGNEYLYASVAGQNAETINRYKPRRIVTQCPHCFHNLKNEYPDFGLAETEVMHEAEFIDELIQAGRLKPHKELAQRVTYHDPCYMARHNRKWDGARSALKAIPGAEVVDVDLSKNRTFCCGAGGGCFWKEEKGGTRINQTRFDQLNQAKPETMAVGCPFCMTQMEDALKSRSLEDQMRVRDLAELIADATGTPSK